MKLFRAVTFLAVAYGVVVGEASPVGKVIELLTGLETKISEEGAAAKKAFSEFSEWCEAEAKNFQFEIKTSKAEIEELKATIEKETGVSNSLSTKIDELAASITTSESDLKAATELRAKEAANFAA